MVALGMVQAVRSLFFLELCLPDSQSMKIRKTAWAILVQSNRDSRSGRAIPVYFYHVTRPTQQMEGS